MIARYTSLSKMYSTVLKKYFKYTQNIILPCLLWFWWSYTPFIKNLFLWNLFWSEKTICRYNFLFDDGIWRSNRLLARYWVNDILVLVNIRLISWPGFLDSYHETWYMWMTYAWIWHGVNKNPKALLFCVHRNCSRGKYNSIRFIWNDGIIDYCFPLTRCKAYEDDIPLKKVQIDPIVWFIFRKVIKWNEPMME